MFFDFYFFLKIPELKVLNKTIGSFPVLFPETGRFFEVFEKAWNWSVL
jgi:hypothetical protein